MITLILLFLLLISVVSYFQLRYIWHKEGKKEAVLYSFLMALAAVVGSMLIAGIPVPNPNDYITMIFEPIGKAILKQ